MKKIIALTVFLLPLHASAQFNKGDVFLGGNLSLSLQNSTSNSNGIYITPSTNNSLSILPAFGYFVNQKLAVGASLGYSYSYEKYSPQIINATYKNSLYSIGGLVRYYLPISNNIYFVIHGAANFGRGTETIGSSNGNGTDTKIPNYTINASVRPYFVFFLSPKWSVEASIASLGYTYNRDLPNVDHSNSFGFSVNSFAFGAAYYFRKK